MNFINYFSESRIRSTHIECLLLDIKKMHISIYLCIVGGEPHCPSNIWVTEEVQLFVEETFSLSVRQGSLLFNNQQLA